MKAAQKKPVSPKEWSRRMTLFNRTDTEARSTLTCNCGATFSWEGIDDRLAPWIEDHMNHVKPKSGAGRTLIDDTMAAAKMMAGASWPSADMTRWALEKLGRTLANKAGELCQGRRSPEQVRSLLLEACGLKDTKGRS